MGGGQWSVGSQCALLLSFGPIGRSTRRPMGAPPRGVPLTGTHAGGRPRRQRRHTPTWTRPSLRLRRTMNKAIMWTMGSAAARLASQLWRQWHGPPTWARRLAAAPSWRATDRCPPNACSANPRVMCWTIQPAASHTPRRFMHCASWPTCQGSPAPAVLERDACTGDRYGYMLWRQAAPHRRGADKVFRDATAHWRASTAGLRARMRAFALRAPPSAPHRKQAVP